MICARIAIVVMVLLAAPAAASAAEPRASLGVARVADGSATVLGASAGAASWHSLRWSADGARLFAVRARLGRPVAVARYEPGMGRRRVLGRLDDVDVAALRPGGEEVAQVLSGPGVRLALTPPGIRPLSFVLLGESSSWSQPQVAWAPDGDKLAVAWEPRPGVWRLRVIDRRGTILGARLLHGDLVDLSPEAFSADGSTLALVVSHGLGQVKGGLTVDDELIVMSATGALASRASGLRIGALTSPTWSPVAFELALAREFEALQIQDVPGSDAGAVDVRVPGEIHAVAWAPDGRRLAVAYARDLDRAPVRLALVSRQGGSPVVLRRIGRGEAQELAFSPDGAQIAYSVAG